MAPFFILVRHFLGSFLGRGLLEDEGIESVRGLFIGVATMLASIGLFLPRHFSVIYASLGGRSYDAALLADGIFLFSLVGLTAVFIAALVSPAMFPDETDYVALLPLPVSRRRFFAAKLTALAIFGGTLILALTALTSIAFPAFSHNAWNESSLPLRMLAHAAAATTAGATGFLLVVALQGLVLISMPHRWLGRASVFLQCFAVGAVVLALPMALRVVTLRQWVASEPEALRWIPTAWAMGIDQAVLGGATPYWATQAWTAAVALAVLTVAVLGSYAVMYRHCERIILPPPPERQTVGGTLTERRLRRSVDTAVFVRVTLRRNRLPLLLMLVFVVGAVAFVAGDVLALVDDMRRRSWGSAPIPLQVTAIRPSLVLMLLGVAGLRMAFLVPIMAKANWIFRLTDTPDNRRRQLSSVYQLCLRTILLPALLAGAGLQVWALGAKSLLTLPLTLALGALIVEIALAGWRRVPFTCTWIPGQRPLVFILITSAAALFVASTIAPFAIVVTTRSAVWAILLSLGLIAAIVVLHRWRVRTWGEQPLVFEDERYDKLQTLSIYR
jgi:hypothetical protein